MSANQEVRQHEARQAATACAPTLHISLISQPGCLPVGLFQSPFHADGKRFDHFSQAARISSRHSQQLYKDRAADAYGPTSRDGRQRGLSQLFGSDVLASEYGQYIRVQGSHLPAPKRFVPNKLVVHLVMPASFSEPPDNIFNAPVIEFWDPGAHGLGGSE
jgi:hypothetical protein